MRWVVGNGNNSHCIDSAETAACYEIFVSWSKKMILSQNFWGNFTVDIYMLSLKPVEIL